MSKFEIKKRPNYTDEAGRKVRGKYEVLELRDVNRDILDKDKKSKKKFDWSDNRWVTRFVTDKFKKAEAYIERRKAFSNSQRKNRNRNK